MSRLHNNRSRFKPAFLLLGWLAMLASIDPVAAETTNLAWARLQNGDAAAACAAVEEAVKQRPSDNANADLSALRRSAQCK